MNYIAKLLAGVAVEWKTLAEVLLPNGYIRGPFGSALKKEVFVADGIPIYEQQHAIYDKRDFRYFIDIEKADRLKRFKVRPDDLIISCSGTIGKISIIDERDRLGVINQALLILRLNTSLVSIKFLKQYLECHTHLIVSSSGGAITNIEKRSVIEKIAIPIPPLSVQKEIVRILKTFKELTTELKAELTTELTARKNQYSYYLNRLFSFTEVEAERKTLNEIGEFQRGKRFVKTDMKSEGIPCIHYGEMYTHYNIWADKTKSFLSEELVENKKLRTAEKGDVVIVAAGETIEDIGKGTAWLGEEGTVIHDACFSYRSPLNPKYVAYYTRTKHFHDQIKKHISSGKISAINAKGLGTVVIPIPPEKEQERIVSILDELDVLSLSIIKELPKEIALRKKQYEFYRNMLLTFPE